MTADLVVQSPSKALRPRTLAEAMEFADRASKSQLVPAAYKGKPADILIAIQMGDEVGLGPVQALLGIAVINGRPTIWGDAMMALVRASPLCEDIKEWYDGEGDALTAYTEATRRGSSPVIGTFSVADAKRALLWGKAGPWQTATLRMLKLRARAFAFRDAFADVLLGLSCAEEARDMVDVTPLVAADPALVA